jgi:5-methylcytosine-specific restriction protein A
VPKTDENLTLTQLLTELSKSWNSYWLTKTTSADHPIHNLVLTEIPNVLRSWAGSTSKLKFEGSDGRGNLVRTPWVATFNLDITSSATKGFYPVYLFRDNMKEMVLEVGFGATQFEEVYGKGKKFFEELQKAVIGMQN